MEVIRLEVGRVGVDCVAFGPAIAVMRWYVQPDRGRQLTLWIPSWRFIWRGSGEMRLTGGFSDSVG